VKPGRTARARPSLDGEPIAPSHIICNVPREFNGGALRSNGLSRRRVSRLQFGLRFEAVV
jgi:hypothetical protein